MVSFAVKSDWGIAKVMETGRVTDSTTDTVNGLVLLQFTRDLDLVGCPVLSRPRTTVLSHNPH